MDGKIGVMSNREITTFTKDGGASTKSSITSRHVSALGSMGTLYSRIKTSALPFFFDQGFDYASL